MDKELTLQEIQQESFNVLLKLKEIFDENGLKYYLAYGTLIGTIRHNGFVPWDDDIDVWVPRKDYELFIKYCKNNKENIYPYQLIHYSNNEKYVYPIARFSDSRYKTYYHNVDDYGLGLFVDIYPLDGISLDDKMFLKKMKRIRRKIDITTDKKYVHGKNIINNIFKFPYYLYTRLLKKSSVLKEADHIAQKYDFDSSDYFCCAVWDTEQNIFNKKTLQGDDEKSECLKNFNGEQFRVPVKYDEILRKIYGDYMQLPPKEKRVPSHNYKSYKK